MQIRKREATKTAAFTISLVILIVGAFFLAPKWKYWSSKDTNAKNHYEQKSLHTNEGANEKYYPQSIDERYNLLIKDRLNRSGLGDLKSKVLPDNTTEIRFWVGFSHDDLRGLIIEGDGANWLGTFVPNLQEGVQASNIQYSLPPPLNGWRHLIDRLQQLGLYNLSGESGNIPETRMVLDVSSVVVEIKTNRHYKTIRYRGVFYFQDPEILKMEKILQVLSSEFAIKLY